MVRLNIISSFSFSARIFNVKLSNHLLLYDVNSYNIIIAMYSNHLLTVHFVIEATHINKSIAIVII